MTKAFMWFGVYVMSFGVFTGMLFNADVGLNVVIVSSALVCVLTFVYTLFLHERITRRPRLYLLFVVLMFLTVQATSELWLFQALESAIDRRAEKIRMFSVEEDVRHAYAGFSQSLLDLAESGDTAAMRSIGRCYLDGYGVKKDVVVSAKWYRLAAERGDLHSQFRVGWLYDHGLGLAADAAEAEKWLRMAAESGEVWAETYLGLCYVRGFCGDPVTKDLSAASFWLDRSSDKGVWVAKELCSMVGRMERMRYSKLWILGLLTVIVVICVILEFGLGAEGDAARA